MDPGFGNFNVNSSAMEAEAYFKRFKFWCLTQTKLSPQIKAAHFYTLIGQEASQLVQKLMYPADLFDVSYEDVKAWILSHVQPANYEIAERAKFNSLVREANESLKIFVLRLQQQAARCYFADNLETA